MFRLRAHHIVFVFVVLLLLSYANFMSTSVRVGDYYRVVSVGAKKNSLALCEGYKWNHPPGCYLMELELTGNNGAPGSRSP